MQGACDDEVTRLRPQTGLALAGKNDTNQLAEGGNSFLE